MPVDSFIGFWNLPGFEGCLIETGCGKQQYAESTTKSGIRCGRPRLTVPAREGTFFTLQLETMPRESAGAFGAPDLHRLGNLQIDPGTHIERKIGDAEV